MYRNGKIYKLVSNHTNQVYIGATCTTLTKRKCQHKKSYKRWLNKKSQYITSYEIMKYDDCDIILIELFPSDSKIELHARERHFIETLDCVNKVIPGRSPKEWYNDNIEHIKSQKKEYYNLNRDCIIEKAKIYSKQYYRDNHEQIKQRRRESRTAKKLLLNTNNTK